MNIQRCIKESFIVIGKEGSTNDENGFVRNLWADANSHFAEVAHLAKKDEVGNLVGIWGAMSDFSCSFHPWEDNFSKGLYLAGVECDHETVFLEMITYLQENDIPLAGAVHDFTCPQTAKNYMFFPIRRL